MLLRFDISWQGCRYLGSWLHPLLHGVGMLSVKGETLQSTYEKIVYDPLYLPEDLNPDLADLLKGLLCKDPTQRFSLEVVANHPWVVMAYGPVDEE
jgi:serine/threonine protein kinase